NRRLEIHAFGPQPVREIDEQDGRLDLDARQRHEANRRCEGQRLTRGEEGQNAPGQAEWDDRRHDQGRAEGAELEDEDRQDGERRYDDRTAHAPEALLAALDLSRGLDLIPRWKHE